MPDRILEGTVVLMTGAGRGLGRAMALGLVEAGASVTMIDVDEDVLREAVAAAQRLGGQGGAMPVVADVTDERSAEEVVAKTIERFGRIGVLVNDAAIGPQAVGGAMFTDPVKFWRPDAALWRRVLDVNAYGSHLMAIKAAPHMLARGWGRIVNVTTSLDTMYLQGGGAYGPSKAALEANTLIMARDLDGTGVTANVLIPGGPANTRMIPEESGFARDALVQPQRMVPPVVWLASEASAAINGMRLQAALWEAGRSPEENVAAAGAPVAWQQLGAQAIRPDRD